MDTQEEKEVQEETTEISAAKKDDTELSAVEKDDTEISEQNTEILEQHKPDYLVRNPRVERVLALEEEISRQREQEKLRGKQIRQEQEYINKLMDLSVEEMLQETKEEQKYNEEFEERIRSQVYRMHGISDDKIQGMREYHNAWYQGAAFSLFFLSMILFVMCGCLHGFDAEVTLFMAFYTAIGGTLLTNGKGQAGVAGVFVKGLYLLLFPAMMTVFVCYELEFSEFAVLLPALTVAGAVILLLGVAAYFFYDPYRVDRKRRKKAENYLREMEKAALKEVRLKEKAYDKQEKKRQKMEERVAKRQERKQKYQQRKEKWSIWWKHKIHRQAES